MQNSILTPAKQTCFVSLVCWRSQTHQVTCAHLFLLFQACSKLQATCSHCTPKLVPWSFNQSELYNATMPTHTQFYPYFHGSSYYIGAKYMQGDRGAPYQWRWFETRYLLELFPMDWADGQPCLGPDHQPIGYCVCMVLEGDNRGWANCNCNRKRRALCVYETWWGWA